MGVDWLEGKTCTGVCGRHPGNFTFEFGDGSLDVECLVRIVVRGELRLTSFDHGRIYGLPAPIDAYEAAGKWLLGRRVASTRPREGTSDLVVVLEGDVELELIADSSGYEPWRLRAPGMLLVAIGGGGFAEFPWENRAEESVDDASEPQTNP